MSKSKPSSPYYLVVKRVEDDAEVKRIELSSGDPRHVDKVLSGLLRQMSDRFFVDTDHAYDPEAPIEA